MIYVPQDNAPRVTGYVVLANQVIELLFTGEPCPLPLAGSEDMRRAWSVPGIVGCWYPTVDGRYAFVSESFTRRGDNPLMTVPRAILHPDSTATITEPNYSTSWEAGQAVRWAQEQAHKAFGQEP